MRILGSRHRRVLCILGLAWLLGGCAGAQLHGTTQVLSLSLGTGGLEEGGVAFVTPSTVTGQEEDKQALALAFVDVIQRERPKANVVALPAALSAINRAGLTADYRHMLEDYRLTGIFDRDILRRIGAATGARYLAQLKLAGFRQDSTNRWGIFGLRIVDTRSTNLRLFVQIWDSRDGSIAWEATDELTFARDTMSEKTVTLKSAVEESARRLVARMP